MEKDENRLKVGTRMSLCAGMGCVACVSSLSGEHLGFLLPPTGQVLPEARTASDKGLLVIKGKKMPEMQVWLEQDANLT